MTIKNFCLLLCTVGIIVALSSCKKDDVDDDAEKGSVRFEMTDAPIDDAKVSGAFVTIAAIQVDGQNVSGFNKTTLDVLAYQNGDTKLLANADIEAKSYSDITLVLDFETDANGSSPGCYVKESGTNAKHKLSSASNEVKLDYIFDVDADSQTDIVFDFDLRKCIKREADTSDSYDFVTNAELEGGVRVLAKSSTGIIKGNCDDAVSSSDKVVVYAYKKGEYNRNTEVNGQGQSNIEFSNAVTSSTLDASGDFELHFLEEGDYELKYCYYEEDTNGDMELKGTMQVNVLGSLNINSISVDASASVTVDVQVTGLLPL